MTFLIIYSIKLLTYMFLCIDLLLCINFFNICIVNTYLFTFV